GWLTARRHAARLRISRAAQRRAAPQRQSKRARLLFRGPAAYVGPPVYGRRLCVHAVWRGARPTRSLGAIGGARVSVLVASLAPALVVYTARQQWERQ